MNTTPKKVKAAKPQKELSEEEKAQVIQLVSEIIDTNKRENALAELSKRRDTIPNLAIYLWHSVGTVASIVQEIICVYPFLNPPTVKKPQSERICNCLTLLQCVASQSETRIYLLNCNNFPLIRILVQKSRKPSSLTNLHLRN